MDVLVTGGAGFIGSNLVRTLAASGDGVRILDDLTTGSLDNLGNVVDAVDVMIGDVQDETSVRAAAVDAEVIFHLAALPSVARSVENPEASNAVNVQGTLKVLSAARQSGVRRVVYASSASVYGNPASLPAHEDMPVSPLSPYAASKLAGEAYCRAFSRTYGLETVSLRFFNIFGPGQDPASEYTTVVPRFVTRMLSGEPPVIFGDGRQSRDFTFVQNAVTACVLAARAGPEAVGQVMNVGCGYRTTLLELVSILNELLGVSISPLFSKARPGDVRDSEAAISRARDLIGYQPLLGVREGLAETIRWFAPRSTLPRPTG